MGAVNGGSDDATLPGDSATLDSGERTHPRAPLRPLSKGESLGRYVIMSRLGAGGMGVVYAAFDPELDRKLAIKLLHHGDGSSSGGERARLLREAQAMAKLSHPNVVSVHDVGEHEGQVFVAMEYVDGSTLREWLKAERRAWREVVDVFMQAGRGLSAAHDKGLIHRDFKPDNVIVARDGRVLVLDFGLARPLEKTDRDPEEAALTNRSRLRELDSMDQALTRAGALVGTPAYMAPEQILGAPTDARTDQFSFCVALYEALYGERPFAGDNLHAIALAVTSGELRPPPSGNPIPGWLRAVLVRGLSGDPDDRWPSMPAVLAALGRDPRRRRLQVAGVAALVLAVGGYFGFAQVQAGRQAAACEAAGAQVGEVWNDDARAALRRALDDTGSKHADEAFVRATPWFDAFAEEWARLRTQVCREAEIEHSLDPDLGRRATACLDQARAVLAGRLASLDRGEGRVVERSVKAGAELPKLDKCVDRRWLANRVEPPDAATRAAVAEVHAMLAQVRLLDDGGKPREALDGAREALERAKATGWAPAIANAHVVIGEMLEGQGEFEAAEKELELGFLAAQSSGDDDLAGYAGSQLVYVVGLHLARKDDAVRWGELTRASIERIGSEGTLAESTLINSLAVVHDVAGEYDQAIELYEKALEVDQAALGPEHPAVATTFNNLAVANHGKGDYDRALELYTRALSIREEALGPYHPDVAETAGNLAVLHEYRGEFDRARELYERALAIARDTYGEEHPTVATGLLNLGLLHDTIGEPERARELVAQALALDEKLLGAEHPDVAGDLASLAIIESALGNTSEAIALATRSLSILETVRGPDHPEVGAQLNNLALMHHEIGDHAAALGLIERALSVKKTALGEDHPDLASTYRNLAKIQSALGRHGAAVEAAEHAVRLDEATWGPDHPDVAESRFELARALDAGQREPARARTLARQALEAYAAAGDAKSSAHDEVAAWLAAHE